MNGPRLGGCPRCAGSGRPGYVAEWVEAYGGTMRSEWHRCPAGCTPASRAAHIRHHEELRAQAAQSSTTDQAPPRTADEQPTPPAAPAAARREPERRTRPTGRTQSARTASSSSTSSAPTRWPAVTLHAADGQWALDVDQVPAPAGTKLPDFFTWLGSGLPLRVEPAHPSGRAGDGWVCLTADALARLGLPAALPSTGKAAAALHAKLAKAAASCGMEISDELGPTLYVFRRKGAPGGPKTSVRLILTPWLGQGTTEKQQAAAALTARLATTSRGVLDAHTLTRRVRSFVTDLGVAPGVTPATTGLLLLDAVRPRTEWTQDETGEWTPRTREGALPTGDTTVPPAAGARHPHTLALLEKSETLCEEEDYKSWARPLTPEEAAMPWTVAVDVCASYLSVSESLPLPAGPLQHTLQPAFTTKVAGLWWCDFTGLPIEDELPHPATFHGTAPRGPSWYATPTVAYMATTYGFDTATITEGYLSSHTVPLLKEWTGRLRGAYKRTYGVLGLHDAQSAKEFFTAHAAHRQIADDDVERQDALVLAAVYKDIYKGATGKWTDSARHLDDEEWMDKVVRSWHYRPELRFHVIAAARIAAHRRLRKTYLLTGRAPVAINVDSYLYPAQAPSPLELLHTDPTTGKPTPGTVRAGIAPGSHKHEASIPTEAVTAALEQRQHPSRLTHDFDIHGQPTAHDAADENGEDSSA